MVSTFLMKNTKLTKQNYIFNYTGNIKKLQITHEKQKKLS